MHIASAPDLLNFNALNGYWRNNPIHVASPSLSEYAADGAGQDPRIGTT